MSTNDLFSMHAEGRCNNNNISHPLMRMALEVFALKSRRHVNPFNLHEALQESLDQCDANLQHGDTVIVSTKYAAISEGRTILLDRIRISNTARKLAERYRIHESVAEAILRESDHIVGGMIGVILATIHDMLAPNAGIDASNAGHNRLVLYPENPHQTAVNLHRSILIKSGVFAGVILVDSRLMPGRVGTTGISVACAGMNPVRDMRGEKDLDGKPLKVTFQAAADSLAAAGNYTMGEGGQGRPFAIARNTDGIYEQRTGHMDVNVEPAQCLYIRSMDNSFVMDGSQHHIRATKSNLAE